MLRHEEMLHLLVLSSSLNALEEEFRVKKGKRWVSKQRLPARSLSAEDTRHAMAMFDEQQKALSFQDRASVRRGDFSVTDSLVDDALKILLCE